MVEQAAKQLVDRELLQQEAQKAGIEVKNEDIDQKIKKMKENIGEKRFSQLLKARGLSMEELRTKIKNQLKVQNWIDTEVKPQIEISEEEMRTYYEKNPQEFKTREKQKFSHILFKAGKQASDKEKEEARQKAKDVRKTLNQEDVAFSEMAKKHSEGPSSSKGGSLGFVTKGEMVPAFEEAAFKLEEGEISDLVKTRFGFHIIKAGEVQSASKESFDEAKASIKERRQEQRISAKIKSLLKKKRQEVNLEITPAK